MPERLIVIGGVAAGMSAASQAKRRNKELEVVVFERDPHISYGACGLPYYLGNVITDPDTLIVLPLEKARKDRGIDVRINHEVVELDAKNKKVRVLNRETDEEFTMEFDRLIYTTGASPVRLNVPGVDLKNIFYLHTLKDGLRIKKYIEENKPSKAVLVGAGFIGLEVAENLAHTGMDVTVIELLDHALGTMDADIAKIATDEMERNGVKFKFETKVEAFEGENGKVKRVITNNGKVETDFVLVGIGVRPNVELAKEAGIELGETGAIKVNDYLRTNFSYIFAGGDCVEYKNRITGKPAFLPLALNANRSGRYAGANAAFNKDVEKFPGTLGSAVAKVFGVEIARTGLSTVDAEKAGIDFESVEIVDKTQAGYFPTKEKITVKLLAEKPSGRLIGAMLAGGQGTGLRIDVLATVLHNNMTIKELSEIDLAYAPPFAPTWDPVLVAANVGKKKFK